MTTILNAKKELKELIGSTGRNMIETAEDTQQKRIIGTISQRLEDAMGVLDSVEASAVEHPAGKGGAALKDKAVRILMHPAVSLVLIIGALALGIITICTGSGENAAWAIRLILILALLLAQGIFRLVIHAGKRNDDRKPDAVAGIDLLKAKVAVTKLAGTMLGDSKAIADMYREEKRKEGNGFENEVIRLYCSLFEARIDNPEVEDLKYAVTLTEMLLRKMGIREVAYTPEQANLFEIHNEEYHDEMRTPALVREKTGEVIRKGEYIRNINGSGR